MYKGSPVFRSLSLSQPWVNIEQVQHTIATTRHHWNIETIVSFTPWWSLGMKCILPHYPILKFNRVKVIMIDPPPGVCTWCYIPPYLLQYNHKNSFSFLYLILVLYLCSLGLGTTWPSEASWRIATSGFYRLWLQSITYIQWLMCVSK